MKIDRVCFYVEDATKTSNWFINNLGFKEIANYRDSHTHTLVIANHSIYLEITSSLDAASHVANYLDNHAPGVVDIVFRVFNLEAIIAKAEKINIPILQSLQIQDNIKWATIQGWNCLQHTLIEFPVENKHCLFLPQLGLINLPNSSALNNNLAIETIDHIVLNVAMGELASAVTRYQKLFGWEIQQTFEIHTKYSGLYSQALIDSNHRIQFNINEPTCKSSQIQEFLDLNGGGGIQHLALKSNNILQTVTEMRSRGVTFLSVPKTYYDRIKQQSIPFLPDWEWQSLEKAQILVDWQINKPQSLLMQTFTRPIFDKPTFFLEIVERRLQARGFGERNFQALFEAVEIEQINR
jgi:4-hydroxyphenylpyruvate dioxygenase